MAVKYLSSMHHFVPTQPLPAPLLLPSPFLKSSAAVQFPIWRHSASPCSLALPTRMPAQTAPHGPAPSLSADPTHGPEQNKVSAIYWQTQ